MTILARCIVRHRWGALIIPLTICLLLVPLAFTVTSKLSVGGWLPQNAESVQVDRLLDGEFGRRTTSNYLLFSDPSGQLLATDPAFRREVERVVAPLRSDANVASVFTWGTTTNRDLNEILISEDRTMSLAVISLKDGTQGASEDFDRFTSLIHSDLLDVKIGGWAATTSALQQLTKSDLVRAEQVSIPITLILLVLIYGGIIAALLPITLAIGAIVIALAALAILSRLTESSVFAVNAVSMLGLAVGIDYALVLVTRFREELRHGRNPEDAIARSLATAGRAILVSGVAVTIGMIGLLAFAVPAAISTGLAGAIVVASSVLLALSSLPAALLILARRFGTRPRYLAGLSQRIGRPLSRPIASLQNWMLNHARASALTCVIVLVILALPVLALSPGSPTMTILPRSNEARQMADIVSTQFPNVSLSPIILIVQPESGRLTSSTNLENLRTLTQNLAAMPEVSHVDSLWSFVPATTSPLVLSGSLTLDRDLQQATMSYVTSRAAVVQISLKGDATEAERDDFVRMLRGSGTTLDHRDFTFLVGGEHANSVDLLATVRERAPIAVGIVILVTWIVLFLQFQSVLLPIKAIVLNLLSIGASFGALVWIFQEGHLSGLLGFEPLGYTVIIVPILMFCFMFGLSMDYEVIMLARIREAWLETNDNRFAIGTGLRQSAGIVTSAATVMLVVFAAFGTSELQIIKALGVGLGIAVFIDATIIRLILLPAAMQLMGRWNWWKPTFRARISREPVTEQKDLT